MNVVFPTYKIYFASEQYTELPHISADPLLHVARPVDAREELDELMALWSIFVAEDDDVKEQAIEQLMKDSDVKEKAIQKLMEDTDFQEKALKDETVRQEFVDREDCQETVKDDATVRGVHVAREDFQEKAGP